MNERVENPRVQPPGEDDASLREYGRQLAIDSLLELTLGSEAPAATAPSDATSPAAAARAVAKRRQKFSWLVAALAASLLVGVVAWRSLRPVGHPVVPEVARQNGRSERPLEGPRIDAKQPDEGPASDATLAGWRIEPTGQAKYQVLKPDRVRLDRGELLVESVAVAAPQQPRPPLVVETPEGQASATGTKFFIGTHPLDEGTGHARTAEPAANPLTQGKVSMSRLTRVFVLAGVVTLVNAQGSVTGQANHLLAAETGQAPVNHAVTANSGFAVDLYRQLVKENSGKNLFFSPYSMSSALAMTAEGARGETADQMGKVLGFPPAARHIGTEAQLLPWNTALIHTGMATLNERFQTKPVPQELRGQLAAARKELEASQAKEKEFQSAKKWQESRQQRGTSAKLAEKVRELSSQVDQYEIRVANALYGEKTHPFRKEFVDTLNRFYGTGAVVPVDFIHNSEAVRQQINTWVEQQTRERIKDLLANGSLDPMTRLVLVNAIYFRGDWAVPFDEKATKQEDFLTSAAQRVSVPMMRKDKLEGGRYGAFNADGSLFATPKRVKRSPKPEAATLYPGRDGFLVAELPYKGKELSMVLLVPQDADGIGALEANLTSANLQAWLGKLEGREVNVQMPKFKLETDYQEMKNTLQALGMRRAFEQGVANFGGMCASSQADLYIGKVCHKAFVEVTEQGTEAAAATAVVVQARSAPADVPFTPTVRADRPFLFAIRDVPTGTILFLGRLVNPALK